MRNVKRKILLAALSLLSVSALSLGSLLHASAADTHPTKFKSIDGAAVKVMQTEMDSGIRFSFLIEKEYFDTLVDGTSFKEGVSVTSYIAPTDILGKTREEISCEDFLIENSGAQAKDIPAEKWNVYQVKDDNGEYVDYVDENEDKWMTSYVYLSNINPKSYTRDISAMARLVDGENTYMSDVETRSIVEVANGLLYVKGETEHQDILRKYLAGYSYDLTLDKSEVLLCGEKETTLSASTNLQTELSWSIDDESIATVENGVITAKSVGQTKVTVTAVGSGETSTCTVRVSNHAFDSYSDLDCNECGKTKEVINLTKVQDVDLDLTFTDVLVMSEENVALDLSAVANVERVSSVVYNNAEIAGVSYANGQLSFPKAVFGSAFGDATLSINVQRNDGSLALVNMPVLLISKAISNAEELDAMYALADALDKNASGKSYAFISDGYFVFDQKVTYNKAYGAWPTWDAAGGKWRKADVHGFKGTIDGRGYTIDGLEINKNFNAFVTLLHADGIIKNIGFTNAKLTGIASSFVCLWGCGTIENVYVQYAAGVFGAGGGYNGTFFATDAARGVPTGGGLKIYDCFVDASKITAEGTTNKSCFIGYAYGKAANIDLTVGYVAMNGVFALGAEGVNNKYAVYIGSAGDFYWPAATAAGLKDHGKTQRELATWNTSYWTITDGIPTWNDSLNK